MMQEITQDHRLDENGNPAGGETRGCGIIIAWQNGPLQLPVNEDGHTAECRWQQSLCEYRATHRACPHPEHACDCNGGRREPSGAFVEGVIAAALGRLEFYQSTRFACRENALAITKLEEALHWCEHRTRDREARRVEGTYEI